MVQPVLSRKCFVPQWLEHEGSSKVQILPGFPEFSVNAITTIQLTLFILFSELYEFDDEGVQSIYWNINYPWPMSNRDVSFEVHVVICVQSVNIIILYIV